MIEANINSQLVSSCASETRWSHISSNLMLALHSKSSCKARLDLKTLGRRKCLCTAIFRMLPSWNILHHMSMWNCIGSSPTYNPLSVNFKCCMIPILLLSFFASFWRGLSALSEYLTTRGRWNWSLSSPMNSERKCNEISEQQSQWNNVTLTEDSDGSYHTSFFHCEHRTHIRWTRTRHECLWMWTWSDISTHSKAVSVGAVTRALAFFQLTWSPVTIGELAAAVIKHTVGSSKGRLMPWGKSFFRHCPIVYTQFRFLSLSTMKGGEKYERY